MLEECHRPFRLENGEPAGTGLGWSIRSHSRLGPLIRKNGGRFNTRAWIGFAPEHDAGAVVLVNIGTRDVSEISDGREGPVDPDSLALWLLERALAEKVEGSREDLVTLFPRLSPFTGVKWRSGKPLVELRGRWFEILAIDDLEIEAIVRHCQERHGERAAMRFGEDLVEVLSEMGHVPDRRVTLRVREPGKKTVRVHRDVEMTAENRERIRDAR